MDARTSHSIIEYVILQSGTLMIWVCQVMMVLTASPDVREIVEWIRICSTRFSSGGLSNTFLRPSS